jgi:signal peptidase I
MSEPSNSTAVKAKKKPTLKENVVSLGFALFFVFLIRSSIFESFKIPSGSLIPTLAIGDYIFVNKFSYGLKVPFTDMFLSEPVYIFRREPPDRGDVIVFKFPKDESIYFIKRVVGLPGDVVEVRDKVLFVNGKEIRRDPMPVSMQKEVLEGGILKDPQYTVSQPEFFMERLERRDGATLDHMMMWDRDNLLSRGFGPYTVPADHFFAMGDNRDVSNDSRFWGPVPMRNIAGRAMAVWFSFWIVNLSDFSVYFHPSRIGKVIH